MVYPSILNIDNGPQPRIALCIYLFIYLLLIFSDIKWYVIWYLNTILIKQIIRFNNKSNI